MCFVVVSIDLGFCTVPAKFMVYSGPLHGGANEAVIRMLVSIERYVCMISASSTTVGANAWILVLKTSLDSWQL